MRTLIAVADDAVVVEILKCLPGIPRPIARQPFTDPALIERLLEDLYLGKDLEFGFRLLDRIVRFTEEIDCIIPLIEQIHSYHKNLIRIVRSEMLCKLIGLNRPTIFQFLVSRLSPVDMPVLLRRNPRLDLSLLGEAAFHGDIDTMKFIYQLDPETLHEQSKSEFIILIIRKLKDQARLIEIIDWIVAQSIGFIRVNSRDVMLAAVTHRLPDVITHLARVYDISLDSGDSHTSPLKFAIKMGYMEGVQTMVKINPMILSNPKQHYLINAARSWSTPEHIIRLYQLGATNLNIDTYFTNTAWISDVIKTLLAMGAEMPQYTSKGYYRYLLTDKEREEIRYKVWFRRGLLQICLDFI